MTPLDRKLAKTFLLARWPETHGQPVCPKHFDGEGVQEEKESRRMNRPELPEYRCELCYTRFSATSGTVLAGSQQPLRVWAFALLTVGGPPTESRRTEKGLRYERIKSGFSEKTVKKLRLKWAGDTQLGPRWREALRTAGVTVASVIGRPSGGKRVSAQ